MTRASFTVLFYIKRIKELKNGTVPIYAKITLNGLFGTFGTQIYQSIKLSEQKLDENFNKNIQGLSSAKDDATKITSIINLTTFLQLQYKQFHEQIFNILCYHALSESSETVKSLLHHDLVSLYLS